MKLTQFVGNNGLTTTVESHGQLLDHLTSVLGSVLHSSTLGTHLSSMTLNHGPVETVSKREFLEVSKNIILNFVNSKVGRSLEGSFRVNGDGLSFVRDNRVELVVNNVGGIELEFRRLDDINNRSSFLEGRNILTNLVETDGELLADNTTQLSLGLVTENNDIGGGVVSDSLASSLGNTRVNTTTKTTIGGRGNEKDLAIIGSLGLSISKESYDRRKYVLISPQNV